MAGSGGKHLEGMDMCDSMDEEKRRLVPKHSNDSTLDDNVEVVIWMRDRVGIHVNLECGQEATAEDFFEIAVEQRQLPTDCENIFSIWLCSPLLELRLKKSHKPFKFAQMWDKFCALYTDANPEEISRDEPVVMFQRNIFMTLEEEMQISNERILSLLYHEAKFNVFEGRYVVQSEEYDQLAGIEACLNLDKYDAKKHTLQFYKEEVHKYYPEHLRNPKNSRLLKFGINENEENRIQRAHRQLSDHHKDVSFENYRPSLYRKYLEICWQYAFYGSAFFEGKIQKNMGKIMGHLPGVNKDMDVLVALNTDGVCIIDQLKEDPILAVPYEKLSWNIVTKEDDNRMAVLFLQFLGEDKKDTKVLQVFCSQAKMMDALINSCVMRKHQKRDQQPPLDIVEEGAKRNQQLPLDRTEGTKIDQQPPLDMVEDGEEKKHYRNTRFCAKVDNKLAKMTLSTYPLSEDD